MKVTAEDAWKLVLMSRCTLTRGELFCDAHVPGSR
jgi:hypothetical protein